MSRLVYRVEPLPESMIPSIWDFNSLSEDDERKYILKMVNKTFESTSLQGKAFSLIKLWVHKDPDEMKKLHNLKNEVKRIADIVHHLQTYVKKKEDSPWAVSLRDVNRFCKLLVYFNENSNVPELGVFFNDRKTRGNMLYTKLEIAIMLSIYFCYVIRMRIQDKRDDLVKSCTRLGKHQQGISVDDFNDIVKKEQLHFLNQMQIKAGIGKNNPLSENIFVTVTCILNQIPLIITGNPGSSKTLAMNLILKSFKGPISNNEFFKQYPTLIGYYYQGSE